MRINEPFLLLNKEVINSSIPKQVIILNQAHMQTHTRKHTHANTDIHAHVSLKFAELNDSLNHQCVTIKNFVYSKMTRNIYYRRKEL